MKIQDYSLMTEREAADYAQGSNVFPKEFIELFDVQSKSISDEERAKAYIYLLKQQGYTVKKKSYSDFIAITGVKKRI